MLCQTCTNEGRCDRAGLCQDHAHAAIPANQPKQCQPGRHCERYARGLGGCVAGYCNPPRPDGVTPCQNAAHMGEHACKDRSQCWEPCGELGNDERHVRVGRTSPEGVKRALGVGVPQIPKENDRG